MCVCVCVCVRGEGAVLVSTTRSALPRGDPWAVVTSSDD